MILHVQHNIQSRTISIDGASSNQQRWYDSVHAGCGWLTSDVTTIISQPNMISVCKRWWAFYYRSDGPKRYWQQEADPWHSQTIWCCRLVFSFERNNFPQRKVVFFSMNSCTQSPADSELVQKIYDLTFTYPWFCILS